MTTAAAAPPPPAAGCVCLWTRTRPPKRLSREPTCPHCVPAPPSDTELLTAVIAAARSRGIPNDGILTRIAYLVPMTREMVRQVRAGGSSPRLRPVLEQLLDDPEPLRPPSRVVLPPDAPPGLLAELQRVWLHGRAAEWPVNLAARARKLGHLALGLIEQAHLAIEMCGGPAEVAARAEVHAPPGAPALNRKYLSRLCRGHTPDTRSLQHLCDVVGLVAEIGPATDLGLHHVDRAEAPTAAGHEPAVAWRPPGEPALVGAGPLPLGEQIADAVQAIGGQAEVVRRAQTVGLPGTVACQPNISALLARATPPSPAILRDLALVTWRIFRIWPDPAHR